MPFATGVDRSLLFILQYRERIFNGDTLKSGLASPADPSEDLIICGEPIEKVPQAALKTQLEML